MEKYLYYGDNLNILREYISDESVDLIYLDPPFNSKATYNVLFKEPTGEESRAQITAFEDTWHWTEETERTFQEIVNTSPAQVVDMITAFRNFIRRNDMLAYLIMMTIRLLELKRVLKDTGSIYLHCDPTASHYLKIVMDTIFGFKNFRNEIIWFYKDPSGKTTRFFRKKHDIILFYSKSNDYFFNPDAVRIPYSESTKRAIERGTISFKRKSKGHPLGKVSEDVWYIPIINSQAKERLGYATQKPIKLLEKIVRASIPYEGNIMDPFCGCGTTISACEYLNHNEDYNLSWIGIDITHLAINLIKWRLKNEYDLEAGEDYKVIGEPEDPEGARELARQNRFQFQWWALSLINARPYSDKKRGADTGIDGFVYFINPEDPKEVKKGIVSVKSGNISVRDIRDLKGVIERENAPIGILLSLQEPTRQMIEEAVGAGFFNEKYQRLQILTISELFKGKRPVLPYQLDFKKKAEKNKKNVKNPESIF